MAPLMLLARAAVGQAVTLYATNPAFRTAVNTGISKLTGGTPAPEKASNAMSGLFNGELTKAFQSKGANLALETPFAKVKGETMGLTQKDDGLARRLTQSGESLIDLAVATLTKVTGYFKEADKTASITPSSDAKPIANSAGSQYQAVASSTHAKPSEKDQQKADLEWEIYLIKAVNRDLGETLKKAEGMKGIHPDLIKDYREQIEKNGRLLATKEAELNGQASPSLKNLLGSSTSPSIVIGATSPSKAGQTPSATVAATAKPEEPVATYEMDDYPAPSR